MKSFNRQQAAWLEEHDEEVRARQRVEDAQIAAVEYRYWKELPDPQGSDLTIHGHIGAMGAAANICSAIVTGVTAEDHQQACQLRDGIIGAENKSMDDAAEILREGADS